MTEKIEFSKYIKLDRGGRLYLGTRLPEIRKAWANLSPPEREGQKILALIRVIDEIQASVRISRNLTTER